MSNKIGHFSYEGGCGVHIHTYVTGFGKIDHLHAFVLRNVNLKISLSYNLAVVSSRSMGLAPEI